jgi:carboxypeptidase C (cathepsin A)
LIFSPPVILGPPLCLQALAKLQWPGAAQFADAKKQVWRLADGTVAGYVLEAVQGARRVGLTHATVRLAGHMVPSKQIFFFRIISNL